MRGDVGNPASARQCNHRDRQQARQMGAVARRAVIGIEDLGVMRPVALDGVARSSVHWMRLLARVQARPTDPERSRYPTKLKARRGQAKSSIRALDPVADEGFTSGGMISVWDPVRHRTRWLGGSLVPVRAWWWFVTGCSGNWEDRPG